jgi:hypothetical protein
MLNVELNTTSDILSEDGSQHTSIAPAVSSSHQPSPHRSGRLAQSESAYGSALPKGSDPSATTLAAIHPFSSTSDPMRNSPDLSGRPASAGEPLCPRERDRDDVRTFAVMVAEELPNSRYVLGWHDPTLCNYEEQIWLPSLARASGRCTLSGKHIHPGNSVYRPRTRGRVMPIDGHAMILTSELVKARTGA